MAAGIQLEFPNASLVFDFSGMIHWSLYHPSWSNLGDPVGNSNSIPNIDQKKLDFLQGTFWHLVKSPGKEPNYSLELVKLWSVCWEEFFHIEKYAILFYISKEQLVYHSVSKAFPMRNE